MFGLRNAICQVQNNLQKQSSPITTGCLCVFVHQTVCLAHLLDGHDISSLTIRALPNGAIGSLRRAVNMLTQQNVKMLRTNSNKRTVSNQKNQNVVYKSFNHILYKICMSKTHAISTYWPSFSLWTKMLLFPKSGLSKLGLTKRIFLCKPQF